MLTTIAAIALSLGASASSGPWALVPIDAVNVHPGHVAAAQRVLEGHLDALGQRFVVLEAGVKDPAVAAREKGAAAVLRCALTRIGQRVKVWMRLEPLEGAPRTAALDAGSPEDLDPVLLRLARQLTSGPAAGDARIGEVTEKEEDVYGRKTASSYVGITVGGTFGGASGGGDALGGLGVYWLYDARTFLADIQAAFGVSQRPSGGGGFAGLTIAGLYPLADRDLTPFVGAGLGFARLELDGHSGTGVEVFGDAGVLLGRTSTVHFRADLKPFVTTFRLTDELGRGSIGYGAQVALGVGF